MTIEELKAKGLILLECLSGSRAYGLATENSDTDIKGVFLLPKNEFYGLNYIPQVNNPSNDIVYYELGRFIELLSVNNPNIMELLNTPDSSVLYKHPIMHKIQSQDFLSKVCKNSFGLYAISQIKRARGLEKKIVNPIEKTRKTLLDFCYVNHNNGSISLPEYLKLMNLNQHECGLVKIAHMDNMYGIYFGDSIQYKGVLSSNDANEVITSSVPKGIQQKALLYVNTDAYTVYCKKYKEYWNWVEHRNEDRYETTIQHGKNYDAKNMMHTFRLLEMAIEIGRERKVNVLRHNRDFLLKIKSGHFDFEELLQRVDILQKELELAFEQCDLQAKPDMFFVNQLLFELRDELYNSSSD